MQMLWNRLKKCSRYTNKVVGECSDGRNQNEGNQQLSMLRQQVGTTNTIPQNEINKRTKNLMHQGCIDNKKHEDYLRTLSLNQRGFGLDDKEKVEMTMNSVKRHEVDVVSLSLPDRKWMLSKVDRIKQKFRRINKEVVVIASNTDQETRKEKEHLPGGGN